jgi:hypothetical protein
VLSCDSFTCNARTVGNDGVLIFVVEQHSFQTAWTNRHISAIFLDYVFWSSAFARESILLHYTVFPKKELQKCILRLVEQRFNGACF